MGMIFKPGLLFTPFYFGYFVRTNRSTFEAPLGVKA